MTLFASKQAFTTLGLEPVQKTLAHTLQDCAICTRPLDLHPNLTPEQQQQYHRPSGLHAAVRIISCGHVVGKECLDAWLDVGQTCPICKRALFEAQRGAITPRDVKETVRVLCRVFRRDAVEASIKRVLERLNEESLGRTWEKGGEREEVGDEGFEFSEGDVWEDEDEMGFEDEDEDEDKEVEDEEMEEEEGWVEEEWEDEEEDENSDVSKD